MRKIVLLLIALMVTLAACNKKKQDNQMNKEEVKPEVTAELIATGEKLFNERTCANCHTIQGDDIGPSIRTIVKTYYEQDKDIIKFLKGEIEHPIVDKDSSQIAMMKSNIEEFIKDLKDEELQAIAAYMKDIAK